MRAEGSKIFVIIFLLAIFIFPLFVYASSSEGIIDPNHKYAWGENIGWINFGCDKCSVRVFDSGLTGFAWSENYGWINLNPDTGGIKNDGEGKLSGYAWAKNLGWINFNNVQINAEGQFKGYAIVETNNSKISFDCPNCKVVTDWRPRSMRKVKTPSNRHLFPTPPIGGFRVLINNGKEYTDSPLVILTLIGGPNTAEMIISNNPAFLGPGTSNKIPYQYTYQWNLCEGLASCPEGTYTVYVKFFTPWGTPSPVISDTIIYKKSFVEILKKIPEIFKPLPPPPKLPEIPIEELVPKEAPEALKGKWKLLSYSRFNLPLTRFTLAPLPKEFQMLTKKFPKLGETFSAIGIKKLIDVERLRPMKLTMPGLTKTLNLPTTRVRPGKFAIPAGVPLAQLTPEMKSQIPTEIVFAKTGGELIDFNIALTVTEKGEPEQRINTVAGKPLQLIVRPEKPAKNIMGYLVFKSKKPQPTSFQLPLSHLTASMIFKMPVFAKPQENPVRVEEKLVLLEFEYTDPDGDGIYTAQIQAPLVEGEYEIITVIEYEDPELGKRAIRLITVVDPEGYVYRRQGREEVRILGAIVSLYWLNPQTKQYELWPAQEYNQENPQVTDVRGTYSFLVPEGYYYLKVEAPGYLTHQSKPFQVKEGSGIHMNIELKTKYWWLTSIDWRTILLIVLAILLLYNFYRDKMREVKLKKHE